MKSFVLGTIIGESVGTGGRGVLGCERLFFGTFNNLKDVEIEVIGIIPSSKSSQQTSIASPCPKNPPKQTNHYNEKILTLMILFLLRYYGVPLTYPSKRVDDGFGLLYFSKQANDVQI